MDERGGGRGEGVGSSHLHLTGLVGPLDAGLVFPYFELQRCIVYWFCWARESALSNEAVAVIVVVDISTL